MIVEFIGSTGAGKTTLISEVHCRLAKSADVTTSFDLVATPLGLRGLTQPTARNLVQEFVGFPFFVGSLHRRKEYVAYTLRMLARQANFSIFTLNNLRSLERKVGVYEIIKRRGRDRIVLVDEGTVLSAHNIFVYSSKTYSSEEIAKFAALVPLPDVIVYIRAPVQDLIDRSLRRMDPPREMRAKNRAQIEEYVNRAAGMFELLIKDEKIQDRVMIVENPDSAENGYERTIDYIAASILNYQPSGILV